MTKRTVNKGKRLLLKADLNLSVVYSKMSFTELQELLAEKLEKADRFPEFFFPEITLLQTLLSQQKQVA